MLDRLQQIRSGELPADVQKTARRLLADCTGVMVAGLEAPGTRIVREYAEEFETRGLYGPLIGLEQTLPLPYAALVNGASVHALDFDDDEPVVTVGHPSGPIVACLLPIAAASERSMDELVRAYVAGIEATFMIGRAVNPRHYVAGWHATSTLGVLGAAAALASLVDCDRQETARILGVAASSAAGLKRNFGTMTKPLHVGLAAQSAVVALELVQRGLDAQTSILDGEDGVLSIFSGDPTAGTAGIAEPHTWAVLDPGIAIKRYPMCSSSHPAVDVLIEMREIITDLEEQVARIECVVAPGTDSMLRYSIPETPLEAKFSMQWAAALAVRNGSIAIDDFSSEAIADERTRHLAELTEMMFDEALNREGTSISTAAMVRVHLRDGTVHEGSADYPLGSPRAPLSDEDLRTKFVICCGRDRDPDAVSETFDQFLNGSSDTPVASVLRLLDLPTATPVG